MSATLESPIVSYSSSPSYYTPLVCKQDPDPSFAVPTIALKVAWSSNSYHGSVYPAPQPSLSSSLSLIWSYSHSFKGSPFSSFILSTTHFLSCTFISTSGSPHGTLILSRRKSAGWCLPQWGIMIWGQPPRDCHSMSHTLYWKTCYLGILWMFWTLGSSALLPLPCPQTLNWNSAGSSPKISSQLSKTAHYLSSWQQASPCLVCRCCW